MSNQKKRQKNRLPVNMCALLLGLCLAVGMGAGVASAETSDHRNLKNGGFEDGPAFTKDYDQPDQSNVPYWNTTAFQGKIELFRENKGTYVTIDNNKILLKPTEGTYAAELNADEESTLYQNVDTLPSSVYKWGLDHGARNGTDIMALVIGPAQEFDPSKPSKDGRDQFMQMVDWLRIDNSTVEVGTVNQYTVYSKKFAAGGTFQDNADNNAFSLTPSTIYTEKWQIWIMASSRAAKEETVNPWNSYGSNGESEEASGVVDDSKYYLYTVPSGQTETLFGFVSVGYVDSPTTAEKAKTYGNFLDNINFELYHPLFGSTTTHGSAMIDGSDGLGGSNGSPEDHEVRVGHELVGYLTDGETLTIQAVVASEDVREDCEFVGVYYTCQASDGTLVTQFIPLSGNEIEDTGSLTDEEKKDKWIKSTNTDGDIIYTYYLENLTSGTNLHFVFIKSPTITYDPNGGKAYRVGQTGSDELENVYSFKPNSAAAVADSFIPPYVSQAAEGQNDGWKFMGWKLTGDTVDEIPADIVPVNSDQLGKLLLPAEHTVACDYSLAGVSGDQKAQYFKIYDGNVPLSEKTNTEDGQVTGVTWTDNGEEIAYANVHRGLTMVAQWRWRQAFIPQLNDGDTYRDSAAGGTVMINGVEEEPYEENGGKAYFAETNETVMVTATANDGYTFRGWYDAKGNLLTTNVTYSYTEAKERVNTYYARFSRNVTQTYIRQVWSNGAWTDTTDDAIGTLSRYTYSDAVGTHITSTAAASTGYSFVGWYDSKGNPVNASMLINDGATISYTTTDDATYYARFVPTDTVVITVIGNSASVEYTGDKQSVSDYTVTYTLNGTTSSTSPTGITLTARDSAKTNAVAEGIKVNTQGYIMALSENDFTVDTSAGYAYILNVIPGKLTITGAEDITVAKTPAETSVTAGDTITWTVTVRNSGSVAARGLILTDTLEGAVVTAPDGIDPTNFSLSAESEVVFTVTCKNAKAGTYVNHVEISQPKYDPDNESATVKLVEADSAKVTVPVPYVPHDPPVSHSKPVLNTEDHYSYIIGYKDGTLRPYGTITRGEVATIFFRLLTDETREEYWSQTNSYSDCDSQLWCNNAISTLSSMGIIDGFADGTFRPYAKITRAQFAKIAVGFFETTKADYEGFFTDVSVGAWYTEYVEAAARVGLIQGFADGAFRPNSNITRAQACVIVNRALNRKPDEEHLLDKDEMLTWVDNNPGDWFYADMQEATNSHDYIWLTEKQETIEEWTAKLPQRDWAALEHAWSTAHSAPGGQVTR